jgi:hypothetical protein
VAAFGALADPLVITKVFVDDGHEEPIRACEFDSVTINSLKDILATGNIPVLWNSIGGVPATVIAPAILVETANVLGVEEEAEKKPSLAAPSAR